MLVRIHDERKAAIFFEFLKELPFIDVVKEQPLQSADQNENSIEDIFGIWKNRDISLESIRNKSWSRV